MPAQASILNTIRTKGATRVIVRLTAPVSLPGGFALEAELNQVNATNQRSIINRIQNTVLSRVSEKRAATAKRYDFIPFMAMEVDQSDLQALIASPEIDFIEEDVAVPPLLAQSVPLIGGVNGTYKGYTGSGQTVAILDTGVEKTHPFLTGKVVAEGCFSTTSHLNNSIAYCSSGSTAPGAGLPCSDTASGCYHGTHVAGIVAGKNGPVGAPSGVARDTGLIAVQVFSQFSGSDNCGSYSTCPMAFDSDMISALQYVYNLRNSYNIASVNMSLGSGQYDAICDSSFPSFKSAIDNLRAAGIATVIASGNNGYSDSISFPACISSAISVGATDKSDVTASYSNSASFLNLLAPGSSIYSSLLNAGYGYLSGTSMATPHVSGAWAVLKSAKPTATVTEILNALVNTGKPITDSRNGIVKTRIQIDQAVYAIVSPLTVTKTGNGSGAVTSSPVGISCGPDCSADFISDTVVTLTATPENGSTFTGWSGDCIGTGACTVSMDTAKSVTATFSLLPVNGACGSADGQTFTSAPTANLCSAGTASNVTGSGPWNWTCIGLYGGGTASCSTGITSFTISTSVTNGAGGTITSGTSIVPYGGSVTFTITPDTGYVLSGLTDNGASVNAVEGPAGTFTYSINNVTADHTVIVTFADAAASAVPALSNWGIILTAGLLLTGLSAARKRIQEHKN
jgi:hypothetical protein